MKGFRKGIEKEDIVKSMTTDDKDQLIKILEDVDKRKAILQLTDDDFNRLKLESKYVELENEHPLRAKIILANDYYKRDMIQTKLKILESVNYVRDIKAALVRLEAERQSGIIKVELKPGLPMNEHELDVFIRKQKHAARAIATDLVAPLAKLQAYIESLDLAKQVVISNKDFVKFAEGIVSECQQLGYDIFDEIV